MNIETEKIIDLINSWERPVYVRYGFGWKGATWEKTTKEALVNIIKGGNYAHYDIYNGVLDGNGISFYSANDML